MPKKFYVSWDNLQREARRLARRQLPVSQWKGIIAVSRGGLVPAALMARELGIRNVETLCISSYDHDNQRELVVVKAATTAGDGEGWLVKGTTDLHALSHTLGVENVVNDEEDIATVAGLVIAVNGQIPRIGDVIELPPLHITIVEANDYRVDMVRIVKEQSVHDEEE